MTELLKPSIPLQKLQNILVMTNLTRIDDENYHLSTPQTIHLTQKRLQAIVFY